jgi:hypothetical protein
MRTKAKCFSSAEPTAFLTILQEQTTRLISLFQKEKREIHSSKLFRIPQTSNIGLAIKSMKER